MRLLMRQKKSGQNPLPALSIALRPIVTLGFKMLRVEAQMRLNETRDKIIAMIIAFMAVEGDHIPT